MEKENEIEENIPMKSIKKLADEIKQKPIKVLGEDKFRVDWRGEPKELLPTKDPGHQPKKEIPRTHYEEEPKGEVKKLEYPETYKDLSAEAKILVEKIENAKKLMDDADAEYMKIVQPAIQSAQGFMKEREERRKEMDTLIQQLGNQISSEMQKKGAEFFKVAEHIIILVNAFITKPEGKGQDIQWQLDKVLQIVKALGNDIDELVNKKLQDAINGATRYVTHDVKEIHRFYDPKYKKESIRTAGIVEWFKNLFNQIRNIFKPVDDSINKIQMKTNELEKIIKTGSIITRKF